MRVEIGSIDAGKIYAESIEQAKLTVLDSADVTVINPDSMNTQAAIPHVNIDAVVGCDLPTYANWDDAGMDLYASQDVRIGPGGRQLVGTGLKLAIPAGVVGLIHPRSGLAAKRGLTVLNAPGTIDSGYRGEIQVIMYNTSSIPQEIKKGDRIAQIVFQQYIKANLVQVESLDETERGSGGFGSTGN